MRIKATIMVEPVPKGRPRMAVKGGRQFVYTPQKTVHAESLIREVLVNKGYFDSGIPLVLHAVFYRQKPKSLPKRVTFPVTKPDLSNLLKTLEDAMEKFVYGNDSQIVEMHVKKEFGIPPRIEFAIESK